MEKDTKTFINEIYLFVSKNHIFFFFFFFCLFVFFFCFFFFFFFFQILQYTGAAIDNGYKIPNLRFTGIICKTNMAANTAFRGYGSPQAILLIEEMIFKIACELNMAPEMVGVLQHISL